MRRIFASPRIENVEGVARLLEAEGIEVRITDGRSYRGAIRGNARAWVAAGMRALGGCCRVTPDQIARMAAELTDR